MYHYDTLKHSIDEMISFIQIYNMRYYYLNLKYINPFCIYISTVSEIYLILHKLNVKKTYNTIAQHNNYY